MYIRKNFSHNKKERREKYDSSKLHSLYSFGNWRTKLGAYWTI